LARLNREIMLDRRGLLERVECTVLMWEKYALQDTTEWDWQKQQSEGPFRVVWGEGRGTFIAPRKGVFLDLARLGKVLSEVSSTEAEKRVLAFVQQHGFLTSQARNEKVAVITSEASEAYQLLTLYDALANKDTSALKRRIEFRKAYKPYEEYELEESDHQELSGGLECWHHPIVDGRVCSLEFRCPPFDRRLACFAFIAQKVTQKTRDVNLGFGGIATVEEPGRPGYKLQETWFCHSLLGYAYLELYALLTDMRPLHTCRHCGLPYAPTKSGPKRPQTFCSRQCRQNHYYREKKTREDEKKRRGS